MKRYYILLFIAFSIAFSGMAKDKWKRVNVTPMEVVCYGSGEVEKSYIPPPEFVINKLKSGSEASSNIVVSYINFPDSIKTAFEYAVNIWEHLIESNVPIYLTVRWQSMNGNTLASCGPTGYYQNMEDFYYRNRFYAVAAAEKIAGEEITGSDSPDITATFNRNVEWYYGTDGNCPDDKYDFVSTVLHEIAHGLGFTGFFYADADHELGDYYDPPAIFDQFVANYQKQFLIDTNLFANPSESLFDELVSNALFFRSPAAIHEGRGSAPRLYAPANWNDGSSIYHLNDLTYRAGNENSLMTHAAGYGEVIHDPGPLTMGIMADIGWKNMFISHTELGDIETVTSPVYIEAEIESDYALDSTSLFAFYSTDNFSTRDTVFLEADANNNSLTGELPVNINQGIISYYIAATDEKERTFFLPPSAPDSTFKLRIGPDEINPVIIHQPKEFILTKSTNTKIEAKVQDNIGIDSVWVEYFFNDSHLQYQGFTNDSSDNYSGTINFGSIQLSEGDSLNYRIIARDASSNQNLSFLPKKDYFSVKVEEVFEPLTHYINDFNDLSNNDFINLGFEIKNTKLFIDGALHSLHPYESPEQANMEYNYTSQLKYPIVLLEGGQMSYDEIVLVEPGETGTVFGEDEFWDYVIVEGSKNQGESWLPLVDGYDSRRVATWLIEYNNGIDGNNSFTRGQKEWFFRSNIDLLENGNFSAGDTILIRFRLFSDPYANGWGWVIDNLKIQNYVPVDDQYISPAEFRIYPNPFNDKLTIELNTQTRVSEASISIYDGYGRNIFTKQVDIQPTGFSEKLDLSGLNPGIYLIQCYGNGKILTSRKVLKH